MFTKTVKSLLVLVSLVVTAAALWSNWGSKQANKQIDGANADINAGNAFTEQASPKISALFTDANLQGFPGNRAKLEPLAREVADLLGKAVEQYRAAAVKFEEAGKQPVDRGVLEYWALKVQVCQKLADVKDSVRKMALLMLDPKITDAEQFQKQLAPLSEATEKLNAEHEQVTAQADKLQSILADKLK